MTYYSTTWFNDWYWSRASYYQTRMPLGLKVISTVAGDLIPLETLRQQCEMVAIDGDSDTESHPDDDLLRGYLEAAIDHAEDLTGLSIALRTWELALDSFPSSPWNGNGIELPRSPLIGIESFTAVEGGSDSDGELDPGDSYILDDFRVPPRLLPVSSWPTITGATNAVRVRFRAGYRTADYFDTDYEGAMMLPASIKQALLLLVGHFNASREDSVEKALSTIPNGFEALLRPKRILLGMA